MVIQHGAKLLPYQRTQTHEKLTVNASPRKDNFMQSLGTSPFNKREMDRVRKENDEKSG